MSVSDAVMDRGRSVVTLRMIALAATAWLSAFPASSTSISSPPDSDGEPACLRTGALASDLNLQVRDAVAVLRQSGHDPRDYRVELRLEDALQPDFPRLGSERATSVVFVPEAGTNRYPLRVHVTHPCVVGWIWRPDDLTPWQRHVIERASPLSPHLPWREADSEIRVTETERHVCVQVGRRNGANQHPNRDELSVTLEKADL